MRVSYTVRASPPPFPALFPQNRGCVFHPSIRFAVRWHDQTVTLFGLIDSGCDVCLFPRHVADSLALPLREGSRAYIRGIDNRSTRFYFHRVTLLIGHYHYPVMVGFADGELGTTALLGQEGFFSQFLITFNYAKRWIDLTPSAETAS